MKWMLTLVMVIGCGVMLGVGLVELVVTLENVDRGQQRVDACLRHAKNWKEADECRHEM
jgi:hypothetical protein